MKQVGIIGFGNMGEAIAAGLKRTQPDIAISVVEPVEQRRRLAGDRYGIDAVEHPEALFDSADVVVLAIKPQVLGDFAASLDAGVTRDARIVSVIAGLPIAYYLHAFGTDQVVRFMPNLAATVGKALVGICHHPSADATTIDYALTIADSIGDRLVVPERLMSAITGVSGSGIAYVFALAHAMALGGTQAGLAYPDALQAAISAIDGAAELLRDTGANPVELLSRVTSPGGTTIEGVAALETGGFTSTVMHAVTAAAARADELEQG